MRSGERSSHCRRTVLSLWRGTHDGWSVAFSMYKMSSSKHVTSMSWHGVAGEQHWSTRFCDYNTGEVKYLWHEKWQGWATRAFNDMQNR